MARVDAVRVIHDERPRQRMVSGGEAGFDALLTAARSGDQAAFARLWRATNPLLVRYLAGMGAADAVDDLASETWLRVVRRLPEFRGDEAGFRGWVVTIARNLLTDYWRRAKRRPETLVPELPETVAADEDETVSGTLQRLGTQQAVRLVATLPTDQAELVLLRVVVGMDVAQVAELVGRSPGAVRVAVHRALHWLAHQLRAQSDPEAADAAAVRGPATVTRSTAITLEGQDEPDP